MADLIPNFRPGDDWTAESVNDLIRKQGAPITVRVGPGLGSRVEGNNIQLWMKQIPYLVKGKVASGGISARSSDSSHGTGSVDLWAKDSSTAAYADTGIKVTVDYISSTTGGLTAGTWVNLMARSDGGYEIVSVDCAN